MTAPAIMSEVMQECGIVIRKIIVLAVLITAATAGALRGYQVGVSNKSEFALMSGVLQEVPREEHSKGKRAIVHVEAVNDTAEITVGETARKGEMVKVWVRKSTRKILDQGITSPSEGVVAGGLLSVLAAVFVMMIAFAVIDYCRHWR